MFDFSAKREFEKCAHQIVEYHCSLKTIESLKKNATNKIITEDDLEFCKNIKFDFFYKTHAPNDEYVTTPRSENTGIKERDNSFSLNFLFPILFVSALVL